MVLTTILLGLINQRSVTGGSTVYCVVPLMWVKQCHKPSPISQSIAGISHSLIDLTTPYMYSYHVLTPLYVYIMFVSCLTFRIQHGILMDFGYDFPMGNVGW